MTKHSKPTLIKFSTHDCSACQFMATFDARVAQELGVAFLDVNMKEPDSYRPYRQILLSQHPEKHGISLPTYLVVHDMDTDFSVRGEIVGAMLEEAFRGRIRTLLDEAISTGQESAGQQPDG